MTRRITEVDKGWNRLQRELNEFGDSFIDIGIQGSEATQDRGGLTNAEIGEIHEFGLGVPQRSFLREWTSSNAAEIQQIIQQAAVMGGLHSLNAEQSMERAGLGLVGSVQERMSAGIPPANSPETIARKGSSTPLIDTGQLRQSITSKPHVPQKGTPRDVL